MLIMEAKQRTSVRILTDAHRMVRMTAADRGVTVQEVLDEIMTRWSVQQAIVVLTEPGAQALTERQREQIREVVERG